MKCVLFTLVNWINKLQEIVECSAKTSARFKRGNHKKFSLCKILTKIPTKEESLHFVKRRKSVHVQ